MLPDGEVLEEHVVLGTEAQALPHSAHTTVEHSFKRQGDEIAYIFKNISYHIEQIS